MVEQLRTQQEFEDFRVVEMVRFETIDIGHRPPAEELGERSPEELAKIAPKEVFGFTIYKILHVDVPLDGEKYHLQSGAVGQRRFYIDAEVYPASALNSLSILERAFFPYDRIKPTGSQRVVRLRNKYWTEFNDRDTVISTNPQGPVRQRK